MLRTIFYNVSFGRNKWPVLYWKRGKKMGYLLCYAWTEYSMNMRARAEAKNVVKSEIYDNFRDAIENYTLLCHTERSVVLADIENENIIRQCAKESDTICIL